MARNTVILDGRERNKRMIFEPDLYRRIRRVKEVWNAFKFLVRGGKFKVFLDFSEIDPRILKPVKVTIAHDGRVIDLGLEQRNAIAGAITRMGRDAGLVLAADDEPGFRVRWSESAQGKAWEEAGFDVTRTPVDMIVQPKA